MENKKDSPGVYFPPPLLYILIFVAGIGLQKIIPIENAFFHLQATKIAGLFFVIVSLFFLIRSLRQFFQTKNTLVLIKSATSLQTNGIYSISRNPMYAGLAILYLGITCFIGNWWTVILFPLLLLVVQEFVIKKEEKYLEREFGQQFRDYAKKVRRWL